MVIWSKKNKNSSLTILYIYYCIFDLFIIIISYHTLFLNKSRQLLSNDKVSSFLPTIKKQFSDNFKNFTFFVDNKNNNEIENIFIHDKGNSLKGLASNKKDRSGNYNFSSKRCC